MNPWIYRWMFLLLGLGSLWAGTHVGTPLSDFGGNTSDTNQVNPLLTKGLEIGVREISFRQNLDTSVNDVPTNPAVLEPFGANPLLDAGKPGVFRSLFVWYYRYTTVIGEIIRPYQNIILLVEIDLANRSLNLVDTAGVSIFKYAQTMYGSFYGVSASLSVNTIPAFGDFYGYRDKWLAQWSSDANFLGPSVRVRDDDINPAGIAGTDFLRWPCGALPTSSTCAHDTLLGPQWGGKSPRLRMAYAPLDSNLDDLVAIHGPSLRYGPNSTAIMVRWEQETTHLFHAIDSIVVPNAYGVYHVDVAADPAQKVLAGWTNETGQTLNLLAWDNNYTTGSPSRLGNVVTISSIDIGANLADSMSANFSLQSLTDDLFIITYARSGVIYYQTADISGGSIVLSGESRVSLPGNSCWRPEVSVNDEYMAFAFYRLSSGLPRPEIVRMQHLGLSVTDTLVRTYGTNGLTFNTIEQGVASKDITVTHHLHFPGRIGVSVDTAGSMVIGFNHERNAQLVGFRNQRIYFDQGTWISQPLDLITAGVSATLQAGDSVRFLSSHLYGNETSYVELFLQRDGVDQSYSDTTSLDATGAFRYRLRLTPVDSFTTPKTDSVSWSWNLKPRVPVITGLRIGQATSSLQGYSASKIYSVVNRRDSVFLNIQAWDLDHPSALTLRVRTVSVSKRVGVAQSYSYSGDLNLVDMGDGSYQGQYMIPPQDVVADTLVLQLYTEDGQWQSNPLLLRLRYRDCLPEDELQVLYTDGAGVAHDTVVSSGAVFRQRMDDSSRISIVMQDSNDAQVSVSWEVRDASGVLAQGNQTLTVPDTLRFWTPQDDLDQQSVTLVGTDSLELNPDTLILLYHDPDTTLRRQIILIPNHFPRLDSVSVTGFMQEGVLQDTLVGRWRFGDDPSYLTSTPGTLVRLVHHGRDVDQVNGDQFRTQWEVLLQNPADKSQWYVDTSVSGDSLWYLFPGNPSEQLAIVRVSQTDLTSATSVDSMYIVFPRIDTVGGWEISMTYLQDSLQFVLGSDRLKAQQVIKVTNIGSLDLEIVSVHTGQDDGAWLDYQIEWGSLEMIQDRTHMNRITTPISLASGEELPIRFLVDVSNQHGDQTVMDTLVIETNDYLAPEIRVPFRVSWDDLPYVTIYTRPQSIRDTLLPLAPYFTVNSSLVFVFSEPVMRSSIPDHLMIYSRLDSMARQVSGITEMESAYENQYLYVSMMRGGKTSKTTTDTIIFTPNYMTASDYFNSTPPPYSFLRADELGLWINNGIVDSVGNAIDLARTHQARVPGSRDTTMIVKVDTSTLQVVQTWPEENGTLNPDEDIRILFSKPLVTSSVWGSDTVQALDLETMEGDSNQTIQILSRFSQRLRSDFRSLSLSRGDSLLSIRPRYKFLSSDSVEVWIGPMLASALGHTLDGNGDGLTRWPVDTADAFHLHFVVGESEFYVFPNPYRASNAEHRAKGSITFKNLHQLKGIHLDEDIDIRIHTIDGSLVFSTRRQKDKLHFAEGENRPPLFDWTLTNNHGRPVASGVYIFTICQGNHVFFKNKLMVIR